MIPSAFEDLPGKAANDYVLKPRARRALSTTSFEIDSAFSQNNYGTKIDLAIYRSNVPISPSK